jgi:citronellol/citronellal dehydrogenase
VTAHYRSIYAPGLFKGKVVLVTGGGSGIGRCIAHELAALGAHAVLIGRKLDKLFDVAGEIAADGGRASFHVCDIREEETVKNTVQAVIAVHGRIDALVNNAGGQYISPLDSISARGWNVVLETNLTGGFLVARECYLQSMRQHGGAIVNIVADIWGSMPNMGHSGAARAGMVSFTETAAIEWARHGVRVNAVAPGYIASSGMDHYPPEAGPMLREMHKTVPFGRFGNEAETSAAVVFLLSPAASFISGEVLRVDGARPQVRMGWPMTVPDEEVRQRDAVRPFDGFHRAAVPRVFQDGAGAAPSAAAEVPAQEPQNGGTLPPPAPKAP